MGTDAERRAQMERHLDFADIDIDTAHALYHDDAVLEFPQSGERFQGVENFKEWRRIYPAEVDFELRSLRGQGDLWVAEGDGQLRRWPRAVRRECPRVPGDKIARETIYVSEGWEAPEWRAKWRAAP